MNIEERIGSGIEARSREGRTVEITGLATVGLVAGVLGATALIFGAIVYVIDPAAAFITTANLVFAAAALSFYALTNRETIGRLMSGRSTIFAVLEAAIVAGVLAGLLAVNYFASRSTLDWDLTRDRIFTLQDQSVQLARGLNEPVKIIGFYKPGDSGRTYLETAVELYRHETSKLSLEFINPDSATPAVVRKYKMSSSSPRIVLIANDDEARQTKIRSPSEEEITNALLKISAKTARKIYFLAGHGEAALDDADSDGGFRRAAQALTDEGYEVAPLSLVQAEKIPDDASVVVLAGAKSSLFPNEVTMLGAWIARGGRALLLLDPGVDSGLGPVFKDLGVEVGDNLVVDPNPAAKAMGFGADAPVVTQFEQHPITAGLRGSALLFYWVRSVAPKIGQSATTVATLLQTSPQSWGETKYADAGDLTRDEADVPGPVPIAVAATRNTAALPGKRTDELRVVVIGDSSFATNRFLPIAANGTLLVDAANWLGGEEAKIAIRPRKRGAARLALTEKQEMGIVFLSVNLVPLALIGFGFSIWAVRRRK